MRRLIKSFKFFLAFASCLFSISLLFVTAMADLSPHLGQADAILVLGAAINTPALTNRSLVGLHLYEQGQAPLLVLSGGRISDKDISEAGYMKKIILQHAASQPPMVLEEQSHTTFQNVKNSRGLLNGAKSVIVVSDEFHLARAFLLLKRNGFKSVYWAGPEPTYYSRDKLMFYYLRETLALIFYLPKLVIN